MPNGTFSLTNLSNISPRDPSNPKTYGHLTLKPPLLNDYIGTPVEHSKRMIVWLSDRQPTSPEKVGAMIWEVPSELTCADIARSLWKSPCKISIRKSCR